MPRQTTPTLRGPAQEDTMSGTAERNSALWKMAASVSGALLALSMSMATASAGEWNYGGPSMRDEVTGWICTTPGCDTLRMPRTKCLCAKQNPGEQRLSRLKLKCSTSVGFKWQACPVKPPFGN